MKLKMKGLARASVGALITYVEYGVIPAILLSYVQQQFQFYVVSPLLLEYVARLSLVLALFAFIRGFLPPRTLAHAAAGLSSVFFSTMYLYLMAGGYVREFGRFTILYENVQVQISTHPLMSFVLMVTLMNGVPFIVEMTQIHKRKVRFKQPPLAFRMIKHREE